MRRTKLLLIAVGVVLTISAFFVANVPLKAEMWPVSLAAILGFSAPVVYGSLRWLGPVKGLMMVLGLGVYALIFETIAIKTGLPYGAFSYGQLLGPHLFDAVPATVLVAWSPLVLGIIPLLPKMGLLKTVVLATVLMVLADTVLDPAAVRLGFWAWQQPGQYYGVPFINFIGWFVSGGIAMAAVIALKQKNQWPTPPTILIINFAAIIFFWSMVNLFSGQWIPVFIGAALLYYIIRRVQDVTLKDR